MFCRSLWKLQFKRNRPSRAKAASCKIYRHIPARWRLVLREEREDRNVTAPGCADKFCTRRLRRTIASSSLSIWFIWFSTWLKVYFGRVWWTTGADSVSCIEHLLLTSCPTLRAEEEEEEEEDAEEAWWRGLCRWGMWSRLGWEEAGPVWPCCWTHRQTKSDARVVKEPLMAFRTNHLSLNTITIIPNNQLSLVIRLFELN